MSWWLLVLIMAVGVCSGVLLARVERVRIRHDDHPTAEPGDDR